MMNRIPYACKCRLSGLARKHGMPDKLYIKRYIHGILYLIISVLRFNLTSHFILLAVYCYTLMITPMHDTKYNKVCPILILSFYVTYNTMRHSIIAYVCL